MRDPTGQEFAWAVGVFEGEGYIVQAGGNYRLGVEMSDLDIIERIHVAFGCGKLMTPRKRQENWKKVYSWYSGRAPESLALLADMYPLLGTRRQHTEVVDCAYGYSGSATV